jgi:hypothetical protein
MATFDHAWGCVFAAGVGGGADAIDRKATRRLGPGIHAELVKLAVQDVIDQQKPRWRERADASSPDAPSVYLTDTGRSGALDSPRPT